MVHLYTSLCNEALMNHFRTKALHCKSLQAHALSSIVIYMEYCLNAQRTRLAMMQCSDALHLVIYRFSELSKLISES